MFKICHYIYKDIEKKLRSSNTEERIGTMKMVL